MIIQEAKRLEQVSEYYFSRKLQQVAEMKKEGMDVLNLGIGNPDLCPSLNTIQALAASANNPAHHGYQGYRGIPELRTAIAQWYKKIYGVSLNSDTEVLPLMGSKEGILHISMAFVNPGDEVLIPDPGYPTYTSVSHLVGAAIRKYDLLPGNHWQIDVRALRDSDLSRVRVMWLNYPHMPTGVNASNRLLEDLIRLAHDHKFLLVNDNPYSLILNKEPKSILHYAGAEEVAIELNSFSKSHNMAGWRLGWVAGKPDYINTILKVKSNMDSGMFLPVQHAAVQALNNSLHWHGEQNKEYAARRILVWKLLDALRCTYDTDQSGLFVWARIPDDAGDSESFADELLQKAQVFITPGFIFGNNGHRYIRVSLCCKQEILKKAILKIETMIRHQTVTI